MWECNKAENGVKNENKKKMCDKGGGCYKNQSKKEENTATQ
jgi:hypothetical protein